jgi:nitroimidazol reductase NimA-like FMN-containing flavoprotein (pyridoxamine 5'-phosphate oxidase superfamily)
MIEILEMRDSEIDDLLKRVNYGHLGCSQDDVPYVVPIFFAYDKPVIYVYTTVGLKSKIIDQNPKVCLQVEEFSQTGGWKSVVIMGEAEKIVDRVEREKAVDAIRRSNPTLLPALAIKWSNDWMRKNVEVVYKIKIREVTGRFTAEVKIASAAARPNYSKPPQII